MYSDIQKFVRIYKRVGGVELSVWAPRSTPEDIKLGRAGGHNGGWRGQWGEQQTLPLSLGYCSAQSPHQIKLVDFERSYCLCGTEMGKYCGDIGKARAGGV